MSQGQVLVTLTSHRSVCVREYVSPVEDPVKKEGVCSIERQKIMSECNDFLGRGRVYDVQ